MKEKLIEQMNKIVPLTGEEKRALTSILKVRTLDRLEYVFQAGSACREVYFISRGLFRVFQLARGVEKTESFLAEQSWYTDFESYLSGRPTQDNFQALEEVEVIYFHRDEIEVLYQEDSRLEKTGRYYAEQAAVCIKNRDELLTLWSPEERYTDPIVATAVSFRVRWRKTMERIRHPRSVLPALLVILAFASTPLVPGEAARFPDVHRHRNSLGTIPRSAGDSSGAGWSDFRCRRSGPVPGEASINCRRACSSRITSLFSPPLSSGSSGGRRSMPLGRSCYR